MIIELKVTSSDGTVLADLRTQVPDTEVTQASNTEVIEVPNTEVGTPRDQRHMSLTEQIYWTVHFNPGIRAGEIAAVLKASTKDSVSAFLTDLKKRGLVENGAGEFNSWQWTVTDAAPPWEAPPWD